MAKATPRIRSNRYPARTDHSAFDTIDGRHPFRNGVPDGFVDYAVRTRHGGTVLYFNFALAREMGLIPGDHPAVLDEHLCKAILETFSLTIINEYDLMQNTRIPARDIRPHKYMATRYLQLQHADKKGLTSGDGRSIWNGCFADHQPGKTTLWDISSCGTGATRLSPATSSEGRFIKTGDQNVSYGCGRADLQEGIGAAINSEIFHYNGIPTERTLAVLAFNDNTSINVRASRNLLRPAHFFYHVKQNDYQGLKGAIDYYIDRQISNGDWPRIAKGKNRYQHLLEQMAVCFGKAAAMFEMEYIFCWMDWDGDNILADAGIIDFGSVRQFGLFHSEYRYEDVDRYSTSIGEQRSKARYIVQTFAQIADFLVTGTKKPLRNFTKDTSLNLFSQTFERTSDELILYKMGFDPKQTGILINDRLSAPVIRSFRGLCRYFEKAKSRRGPHKVGDGITWDAIFCLRDILRELPKLYLDNGASPIQPDTFINILKSNYASKKDLSLYPSRKTRIRRFQTTYKKLVDRAAHLSGKHTEKTLESMASRSSLINRYERVTGDSLIYVTEELVKNRHKLTSAELHAIISSFVEQQILCPEHFERTITSVAPPVNKKARRIVAGMMKAVETCREGI